jgi:hypothetical protein
MQTKKLKQLQYESDTWKRTLGFLIDENIHLKNRLSEILKEQFDNNLLDEVEVFQNKFIQEDKLISLIRNDVAEIDKLLTREIFEDSKIATQFDKNLQMVRNNILNAEKEFSRLKLEFNGYLSENI